MAINSSFAGGFVMQSLIKEARVSGLDVSIKRGLKKSKSLIAVALLHIVGISDMAASNGGIPKPSAFEG